MTQVQSIKFPRMCITVNVVGDNSLCGALAIRLTEKGYINHIECLEPEEIVFVINKVMPEVNLYEEINKVRDIFKIDENKITVFGIKD